MGEGGGAVAPKNKQTNKQMYFNSCLMRLLFQPKRVVPLTVNYYQDCCCDKVPPCSSNVEISTESNAFLLHFFVPDLN